MLATGAGVVWMAVIMRGPEALESPETLLNALRTVVSSTAPDSMFQVLAVFGIATTVALENAIKSISFGQGQRDESDREIHEAFVRRRAANLLVVVVGVLGGIAGFLGVWLVLPITGDDQLLGLIYLAFGVFLWNEGRRLAIATRQDERLRVESVLALSGLQNRIRTLEKHQRRGGWLWLAGSIFGVSVTLMVTRLVLETGAWSPALATGAASAVLWAGIAYVMLQTVGDHFEGQRFGLGVGALLCAASVSLWLMLVMLALIGAADSPRSLVVGLVVTMTISSSLALLVVRGALNSGIAAPISSLLLNRLRRTLARRQKGTESSLIDAFGGPGK